MSGERNQRFPPTREDIEAIRRYRAPLDLPRKAGGQRRDGLDEGFADGGLVIGHGVNIHEPARKLENVGHALCLKALVTGWRQRRKDERQAAVFTSR
jgi:hypothetical protein